MLENALDKLFSCRDGFPPTRPRPRTMATSTASEATNHVPLIRKAVGGRYVIERLIGRGGVGLVYLADDSRTHARQVVVKVLAPHWAEDRDAVARFNREALRMAKLDHPNVVKMF